MHYYLGLFKKRNRYISRKFACKLHINATTKLIASFLANSRK